MFELIPPSDDLGLPSGWFDSEDISIYKWLYSKLRDNVNTAEIGVWKGRSICSIADVILSKEIKVCAVDNFIGVESMDNGPLKQIFIENISRYGLGENVTLYESDSVEASRQISGIELAFIDGNHLPGAVKADLISWYDRIEPNGILAGHDYQWVKNVVHDVFCNVHTDNRNMFWIYK